MPSCIPDRESIPVYTHIRANDPRYTHLPLVQPRPDGTLEVVRGDAHVAERLMARPETRDLFSKHRVGKVYFVAENRRGGLWFGPTGRSRIAVGMLEYHLYTAPLPLNQDLSWARNLSDLRAMLLEQVAKLEELAADGWEVVPSGESYRLLDTHRPADDL